MGIFNNLFSNKGSVTKMDNLPPAQVSPTLLTEAGPTTPDINKTVSNDLNKKIIRVQLLRMRQDVSTWRQAISEAERAYFPYRFQMQRIFIDTILNGHVKACMDRRKDLTLLRKWEFVNSAGVEDAATKMLFYSLVKDRMVPKQWFLNFISHALDAIFFGYTLVSLGDIINSSFPNLNAIKRWNISPDRLCVMSFPYMPHGIEFLKTEFKDWNIWIDTPNDIGSSSCGFGILYNIAIYEIMLRNLFGFNGDFVELYSAPFRHGKTTKTDEGERDEFETAVREMGSAGYAITDPQDEILFLETALGGTGWKGYENLEQRCEKKISKMILGHADALDSTPGKLGSSDGEASPAGNALRDKQTKDGDWIVSIVNDLLLPAMRNLGFMIPEDVSGILKNDNEIMENANMVTDLAVKIKSAGFSMDAKYFSDQTGIPVSVPAVQVPGANGKAGQDNNPDKGQETDENAPDIEDKNDKIEISKKLKNKLNLIYK